MFKEIFYFIPKISNADANKMEKSLNGRFDNIAKRLGKGIKAAFSVATVITFALAIVDKIINPLKEVTDLIDKSLGRADDLKTQATQFNTTSGKLFKLQQLAQAKGLDPNELNVLIQKFQTSVAQAINDPSKDTSVRGFAKPGQDTAEQFFLFIQNLRKLAPEQRVLVQAEVFGEKQIGKMSEFLNESNLQDLLTKVAPAAADKYTRKIDEGARLSDLNQEFKTARSGTDFLQTISRVNDKTVTGINESEAKKEQNARDNLFFFNTIKNMDDNMTGMLRSIELIALGVGDWRKAWPLFLTQMKKLPITKMARGWLPGKDK